MELEYEENYETFEETKEEENDPEKEYYKQILKERKSGNSDEQVMGDLYDVYSKVSGVHSKISGMTEDYTLTRYDIDIYNEKLPKFVREQRKLLRIIKSYLIIPYNILRNKYSPEKAKEVYKGLINEYLNIQELLASEVDETVIMGRGYRGEVLNAMLKHGLGNEGREEYDADNERPSMKDKLNERSQ